MKQEVVRKIDGSIIGFIDFLPDGDKQGRLFNGNKIVGFYRKNLDLTVDYYNRPITQGDTLKALIMEYK